MKINFKVESLNGQEVNLVADDGTKIIWPLNKLPDNLIVDQVLYFNIAPTDKPSGATPKEVLNEILDTQ